MIIAKFINSDSVVPGLYGESYSPLDEIDGSQFLTRIFFEQSMIEKTDETASLELLCRNRLGRLGCVLNDGGPYVVPVNYIFQDGSVYVHSMPGLKIDAMQANNSVCIQTDDVSNDGFSWQSVIAFGQFEVVSEESEIDRVLNVFYKVFPGFTPVEARLDAKAAKREPIVFRITIKKLTGVRETS